MNKLLLISIFCASFIFSNTLHATNDTSEDMTETEKEALIKNITNAAEQGDVMAQSGLGMFYMFGKYVKKQDYKQSFYWYHKAAEQGDIDSQRNIGHMYNEGKGVRQDFSKAFQWYKKAAEQGDVKSQILIGDMYIRGKGVKQNTRLGKEWFGKGCDSGEQIACDAYRIANENGF